MKYQLFTWAQQLKDKRALTYLVHAGEPQSVEHWYENMSWNEEAKNVGTADEPVLSTVSVDLCWDTDNRYGRLERGDKRKGHRKTVHVSVCH